MKILITNLGTILDNIVSSSILTALVRKVSSPNITWCVKYDTDKYIWTYNKNIKRVVSLSELISVDDEFDLLINLNSFFPHEICDKIKVKDALGLSFHKEDNYYRSILDFQREDNSISLLQVYYNLAGMTWKGEGYNIGYYPKSKSKKNRVGIAVAHANLRNYLTEELDLSSMNLWHIPYKKNIFKRMDEINKCSKIVTDDLLTFHLAVSLKKYVYFLKTFPISTKLEFFGKGEVHDVPNRIFG